MERVLFYLKVYTETGGFSPAQDGVMNQHIFTQG